MYRIGSGPLGNLSPWTLYSVMVGGVEIPIYVNSDNGFSGIPAGYRAFCGDERKKNSKLMEFLDALDWWNANGSNGGY